jgi:hypothetical protein
VFELPNKHYTADDLARVFVPVRRFMLVEAAAHWEQSESMKTIDE